MGLDIRWMCKSCKVVFFGGSDMLSIDFKRNVKANDKNIKRLKNIANEIEEIFDDYYSHKLVMIDTLNILIKWLERHKGHTIKLMDDHSLDMDDYDFYESGMGQEHYDKLSNKFYVTYVTKTFIDKKIAEAKEASEKYEEPR